MTRPSRPHLAALFPMISGADGEAWARHAHPVSVWTRILFGLPLLILAGWSRVWIGPWWIAVLVAAVVFIWINPRMTPVPRSTDNWGSKSTIGERLWLRMSRDEVPPWHRTVPRVLMVGSALGHAPLLYGVIALDPWPSRMRRRLRRWNDRLGFRADGAHEAPKVLNDLLALASAEGLAPPERLAMMRPAREPGSSVAPMG